MHTDNRTNNLFELENKFVLQRKKFFPVPRADGLLKQFQEI